jgi:Capsular polysaccharide biosynthesis protein
MSNFNKPVLNFGINRNEVNLKLYFSRSKLGMHQKKAFNEAEVEKIFQKFGFKIIFPEKLSLYQQVELLDNAKIIAGCNGSGLHMGIFLRPGSKIIELTAGKINSNQILVSALNNIETHFICANGGNPSIGLSWELDIPHISKHLNQILE